MKFKGKDIKKGSVDYAVVDRGVDQIVFKIETVSDYSDFDKLCPMPEAPTIKPAGKPAFKDVEDKTFKKEVEEYALKKLSWGFIKSIENSENIEMGERIDLSNSETWALVFEDLGEALTTGEVDYILGKFNEVQGLTNEKIKESTEAFLASLAKGLES
jgi:hypothetical protein